MSAHPEAGRFDRTHGDEGKTGPVLTGATVEALDDEVDRLTAERDEWRELARGLFSIFDCVIQSDEAALRAEWLPKAKAAFAAEDL